MKNWLTSLFVEHPRRVYALGVFYVQKKGREPKPPANAATCTPAQTPTKKPSQPKPERANRDTATRPSPPKQTSQAATELTATPHLPHRQGLTPHRPAPAQKTRATARKQRLPGRATPAPSKAAQTAPERAGSKKQKPAPQRAGLAGRRTASHTPSRSQDAAHETSSKRKRQRANAAARATRTRSENERKTWQKSRWGKAGQQRHKHGQQAPARAHGKGGTKGKEERTHRKEESKPHKRRRSAEA